MSTTTTPAQDAHIASIRWQEPPATMGPGASQRWAEGALRALRRHPGKWARLKDYRSPTGAWTAARSYRHLFEGCELRPATVPDEEPIRCALFGRYTEEDDL